MHKIVHESLFVKLFKTVLLGPNKVVCDSWASNRVCYRVKINEENKEWKSGWKKSG